VSNVQNYLKNLQEVSKDKFINQQRKNPKFGYLEKFVATAILFAIVVTGGWLLAKNKNVIY
jgi:hypothetical protein